MHSERCDCVHIVDVLHAVFYSLRKKRVLSCYCYPWLFTIMPWPFRTSGLVIWMFLFRFVLQRCSRCSWHKLFTGAATSMLRSWFVRGLLCVYDVFIADESFSCSSHVVLLTDIRQRAMWNDFISSHPALGRCVARKIRYSVHSDEVFAATNPEKVTHRHTLIEISCHTITDFHRRCLCKLNDSKALRL
jgi:hypothetical protein